MSFIEIMKFGAIVSMPALGVMIWYFRRPNKVSFAAVIITTVIYSLLAGGNI